MSHRSDRVAVLTLTSALVAYAASASPIHRVQYEVYNDQQSAPREPASDLQTVANQQTPSELQSHGTQQHSDQPSSTPQQPNAFVSGKSNEPQDVAQTEPQSGAQEQKSSEPPGSQQAPSSPETKSGEDDDPYNP